MYQCTQSLSPLPMAIKPNHRLLMCIHSSLVISLTLFPNYQTFNHKKVVLQKVQPTRCWEEYRCRMGIMLQPKRRCSRCMANTAWHLIFPTILMATLHLDQ